MSGLADAQELYDILLKINNLLDGITVEASKMDAKLPERTAMLITVQQLLRTFWRLTALLKHMGLSEDAGNAINMLNHVAQTAMHAYFALSLIEKSTVYGQIAGVIGLINVGISASTMLEGY